MGLRAEAVVASDASSDLRAAACCDVCLGASRELYRHTLSKGSGTASKAALIPSRSSRVPAKTTAPTRSAWEEIALSMPFRAFGKITKLKRRRHMNLGEVRAAAQAEEKLSRSCQDCRYVHCVCICRVLRFPLPP